MNTKLNLAVLLTIVGLSGNASGALFSYNWTSINATIPDGDVNGYVNSQSVSDGIQGNDLFLPSPYIANVVGVRIEFSGGWNGDLYAYLRYDSGNGVGFTTLINRVGTTASPFNPIGYTTAGMRVTLTDYSGSDIHTVQSPTSGGTYLVDSTGSSTTFDSFNGLNPVGTWTLFLADLSGNHVSQLNSWGLDLEVVPEPTTWALIGFGAAFACAGVVRSWRNRGRVAR